ncbi:MAG TPA: PQQ-binding-like beta-propeller repeat protein [Phycisphaerae bacterium]|jgi:outer membrane protein assembly factor BamB/tetratricopeptide (TPR) repeat protein|nr:PQQ-binding-like beta-propeller repeat protein [Phycisphaerae bacterium]HOJ56247.1 PQQ-binding-like beta-propeller repeat protein [Phycisphaerae bacterium]HOL27849.1 PQQ-binding-like beta-propeller repeat protein [Phycisphaerae bacterium]HPP19669.1 PQQ-binding-like beta-propeller repeat protein [Phycisphaerae bacterium]HPU31585.1 PQQ-binding-like beta-propeller repeat protein [Phycisphaerae bacterium]
MRLVVVFISWLMGMGWALAAVAGEPASRPEAPEPAEPLTWPEVYVREDFEARQALARLRRLETESRWGEAAEGYDRLVGEAGDALVQVDSSHYRNVTDYVRERLLGWPAAGRERYTAAFGERAARRLEQLGQDASAEAWLDLAERFWLTPAGREAARRAVDVLMGEGRVETGRRWLAELGEAPGERRESGQSGQPAERDAAVEGGGSEGSFPGAVPGEVFWKVALEPLTGQRQARAPLDSSLPSGDQAGQVPARPKTSPADLAPVVAGPRVYVQFAGRLWAIGINSGLAEWSVGPSGLEDEDVVPRDCERGGLVPAVAAGRVFANLTWCDEGEMGASRLVCVDGITGRILWQVEASPPDLGGRFRPVEFFDGSPLLYEGRLYVVVRRRRELTFEDCRLACFDPGTGQRLWDVLIASGPTGEGAGRVMTRSDPVGAEGDIFVQTHLGATARVDGLRGRVRWVTLDPTAVWTASASADRPANRILAARSTVAPPVVHPVLLGRIGLDRLCVLTVPAGSREVVVYDVGNGREVFRLGREEVGDFRYVAGVAEGMLYTVGAQVIACDLSERRIAWAVDLQAAKGAELQGRPFLGPDRLWVSTESGLEWIARDGRHRGRVAWQAMDAPRGQACTGGDVVLSDGAMLVSGPEGLWRLTPRGEGLKQLIAHAEGERDDCAAWLALARFALQRPAEAQRGLAALERAVRCAASAAALKGVEAEHEARRVRDRAFELAIETAEQWSADGVSEEDLFDALLARAAEAAGGHEQQVRYRFVFAAGYERLGRVAEAVRLYQEVLDDAGLRAVGGREAERAIDRLLGRHGRTAYATFDEWAARMLRAGVERGDPAMVREVIERYPNSGALPEALLAWVTMERRAGRPLAAVRLAQDVLRRRATAVTLQKAGQTPVSWQVAVIAQIAEGYFEAGDVLHGLAWLERGRRAHGSEKWLEEGWEETFASLRERLVGRGVQVQRDWPRVAPPLRQVYRLERPGANLLPPQGRAAGFRDAVGGEPVLLFTEGRLEALDPASGQRLWEATPVTVGTPVWLGTRGELLVFSTRFQLFALDRRNGEVRWVVGDVPRKALSAAIDPEILTQASSWALGETLAVALLTDGRGVAVELTSGVVLWDRPLPRRAGGACILNDEHVAYVAQGQPADLVILEAATGREVGVLPVGQAGQVLWCGFTPLRTILAIGGDWLECFDPYTKARLWRVEGLAPVRAGSILVGASGFYTAHETGMACRSYADGKLLWERELAGLAGGGVLQGWLDAGRVYVWTGRGAAALEANSGQVLWAARWDEAPGADSAWLTQRHLLMTGVQPVMEEGAIRWELRAFWVDRETGRQVSAEGEPLEKCEAVPEVGVQDRVLIIRAGATVTGWVNEAESRPSG